MAVRKAVFADVEQIKAIYEYARQRMRLSGNNTQWVNGYPSEEIIRNDIAGGNGYVIEENGRIVGVFAFIVGEDPTYKRIEGAWPDDNPYGTIHRIAAASGSTGIADIALDFCKNFDVNIRIDTHQDNIAMLGWINSRGFNYCGIIYVGDGTPRRAYQYSR